MTKSIIVTTTEGKEYSVSGNSDDVSFTLSKHLFTMQCTGKTIRIPNDTIDTIYINNEDDTGECEASISGDEIQTFGMTAYDELLAMLYIHD